MFVLAHRLQLPNAANDCVRSSNQHVFDCGSFWRAPIDDEHADEGRLIKIARGRRGELGLAIAELDQIKVLDAFGVLFASVRARNMIRDRLQEVCQLHDVTERPVLAMNGRVDREPRQGASMWRVSRDVRVTSSRDGAWQARIILDLPVGQQERSVWRFLGPSR